MSRIIQRPIQVLSAKAANGAGVALDVSNYDFVTLQMYTTNSASATIKFAVSMSLKKPNFSIAPSATNVYDFIQLTWLNNETTVVVGSTGIVLTGTDIIKLYAVDTSFVRWICPIISGFTAGKISCDIDGAAHSSR